MFLESFNKKEAYKKENSESFNIKEIIKNNPPHFSVSEIIEATIPKAGEDKKNILREKLEEYFEKEIIKQEEKEYKEELARVNNWETYKKELVKQERKDLKEKKAILLEEAKDKILDETVINRWVDLIKDKYPHKANIPSWRIGVAARAIAEEYFNKLGEKFTPKKIETFAEMLKTHRENTLKERDREMRARSARDPSEPNRKEDEEDEEDKESEEDSD